MSATEPRRSRTATTLLAIVALIATFMIGAVAGVLAHRGLIMRGNWSGSEAFMMKRLDHRLDLTPQQETQITDILRRHHESMRGNVEREIESANADIERVLTPEQRAKFAKIKMHMQPRRTGDGLRFKHD